MISPMTKQGIWTKWQWPFDPEKPCGFPMEKPSVP